MIRKIELLAPSGDIDSIKAAILAGADAVYCGLDKFNARNRAKNIVLNELNGILHFAHQNNCKVFLTLNILIVESEIPALIRLLNKLINTDIDGVIVQDLGLLYLLNTYFKDLKIHASTQMTTHNEGQIKFLSHLSATRVNLSRELNINEIRELTEVGHANNILTELFVHGSNCISFSGLCYMSSVQGGKSGNRGRCSQPCRAKFVTTPEGKNYPLNIKDNCAYSDLKKLYDADVDSLKIEGRIKKFDYVYTVVDIWRKQLDRFSKQNKVDVDKSTLYKVFNRELSNDFLNGNITKNMFIDNPRDNSATHLAKSNGCFSKKSVDKARQVINTERADIIGDLKKRIKELSFHSSSNNPKAIIPHDIPALKWRNDVVTPTLSVLISSQRDATLCDELSADIYYQLPNCFEEDYSGLIDLFEKNKKLIPWFPSLLIENNYCIAVEFLRQLCPNTIVTDNSGIACEAFKQGIPWIAGPNFNIVNSYAILCLKEKFNCTGAFVSNELKRNQIGSIKNPESFKLFYSIYHPITLMSSRQCLFHQVTGCEKSKVDNSCLLHCSKYSSITNLEGSSVCIEKSKGNYHRIYNDINYLNTDIFYEIPKKFSSFLIDLRNIKTGTEVKVNKTELIQLFQEHLNGKASAGEILKQVVHPTSNNQYIKGI